MPSYMFDTNVFNNILDGKVELESLPSSNQYLVTHIQRNEIENTKNQVRREALLHTFHSIEKTQLPTESAFWGVSEWGAAKWSSDDGFIESIIDNLNKKNNEKSNNGMDGLIAETALKNKLILVTDDRHLCEVILEMGGNAISLHEFMATSSKRHQ